MARIDCRYQTPIGELSAIKPLQLGSLTPGASAQANAYRSPRKLQTTQAGTSGGFFQGRSPLRYVSPPSRQSITGPLQAMTPSASSPIIEPFGLPQHATFRFPVAHSLEVGSLRAPLRVSAAQPMIRRGPGSSASNLGTRRSLTSTPGVSASMRGSMTSTPGVAAEMRGSFASMPGVPGEARRTMQSFSAEIPVASPLPETPTWCPRSPAEASNTRSTQCSRAKAIHRSDDTARAFSMFLKSPAPRSVYVGSPMSPRSPRTPRSPRRHPLPQTALTRSNRALGVVDSRRKFDVLPTASTPTKANGHSPASREAASSRGEKVATTERSGAGISQSTTALIVEDIRPGSVCIPIPLSGRRNANSTSSTTGGDVKLPSCVISADRLPATPPTAMVAEDSKPVAIASSRRESDILRNCCTSLIVDDTPAPSAAVLPSDIEASIAPSPEDGSEVGNSCANRRGVSFAEAIAVMSPRSPSEGSDLSDRYPLITASTSTVAQFDSGSPLFRGERPTSPSIPKIPGADVTKSTATARLFESDDSIAIPKIPGPDVTKSSATAKLFESDDSLCDPRRGLSASTIALSIEERRRDLSESTIGVADFIGSDRRNLFEEDRRDPFDNAFGVADSIGNDRRELSQITIANPNGDRNEHQRSRRSSRTDSSVAETVPSSTETHILSGSDRPEEEFRISGSARLIDTAVETTAAGKQTVEKATIGKAASGRIDGKWSKASISGTVLTWNTGSKSQIEIVDAGKITMKWTQYPECLPACNCFPAKIFTAVLEDDGKLHWSDGDVWARKAEENDR